MRVHGTVLRHENALSTIEWPEQVACKDYVRTLARDLVSRPLVVEPAGVGGNWLDSGAP